MPAEHISFHNWEQNPVFLELLISMLTAAHWQKVDPALCSIGNCCPLEGIIYNFFHEFSISAEVLRYSQENQSNMM